MIIAVIGKGGVGKTTVTALLLRRLLDAGETPVLAVDADPSNCLGPALGLTITRTLAELRDDLRESDERAGKAGGAGRAGGAGLPRRSAVAMSGAKAGRPPSMAKSDWLALQAEDAIVEQTGFDLLTMGHSEGPGCYCFVNNLIKNHLDRLARNYRHVLVDCEAGLEHLSRRTSGRPDRLVCVANGSRMSMETIRTALELYRGLNGTVPRVDLVVNGRAGPFDPSTSSGSPRAASRGDSLPLAQGRQVGQVGGLGEFTSVIRVPWDEAIAELDAAGKSLLELDGASPALTAINDWSLVPGP